MSRNNPLTSTLFSLLVCPEVQGVYLFIRRTKQKNIVFRILENKIEPNDLFSIIPL